MLKYHCDLCDRAIQSTSNIVNDFNQGTLIGLYGIQGPLRACDACFDLYKSGIDPIQEELKKQEEAANKARLEMFLTLFPEMPQSSREIVLSARQLT